MMTRALLRGLGFALAITLVSVAPMSPPQVNQNPPPDCDEIEEYLNERGYTMTGCGALAPSRWNRVLAGFTYGSSRPGNSCTATPQYFVNRFVSSWVCDDTKFTFTSMTNNATNRQVGGLHFPSHKYIAWKNDYVPEYLLHEVLHHWYPNEDHDTLTQLAKELTENCYKPPPPPPGGGGAGNGTPITFGFWVFTAAVYEEECVDAGDAGWTCTRKSSGSPDGGWYYECSGQGVVCINTLVSEGSWVWVEITM